MDFYVTKSRKGNDAFGKAMEEYQANQSDTWIKLFGESPDGTDALTFDNCIYRILYYFEKDDKDAMIREINSTMERLAKLKTNLSQFDGKRELVKSLLEPSGWEGLSYEKLESIRSDLRDLMKYKGASSSTFIVFEIKDTEKILFLKEIRAEEASRVLHQYIKDGNYETCNSLLNAIKCDLLVLEGLSGRRDFK